MPMCKKQHVYKQRQDGSKANSKEIFSIWHLLLQHCRVSQPDTGTRLQSARLEVRVRSYSTINSRQSGAVNATTRSTLLTTANNSQIAI